MATVAIAAPIAAAAAREEDGTSSDFEEEGVPEPPSKKRGFEEEEDEAEPPSKKPYPSRAAAGEAAGGDGSGSSGASAPADPPAVVEAAAPVPDGIGSDMEDSATEAAAPATEAPAALIIWEFQRKEGFEAFADDLHAEIEEKFQGGAKVGTVVSRGNTVVLDFKTMKQHLEGSTWKRRLQRTSLAAVWEFSVRKDDFEAFETSQQANVERAYKLSKEGGPSNAKITIGGGKGRKVVLLDFVAMTQSLEGSSTGRSRKLRRRDL